MSSFNIKIFVWPEDGFVESDLTFLEPKNIWDKLLQKIKVGILIF